MADASQVPVATRHARPPGPPPKRKRKPRPPATFKDRARAAMVDAVAGIMAACYGCIPGALSGLILSQESAGVIALSTGFLGWLCYHWLTIASSGQTAGKEMLGVRVVRLDGRPVSRYQALGRVLAKLLSWLTLGAGFLVPLFRQDKRSLHDLVARTKVVAWPTRPVPPRPAAQPGA